MELFQTADFPFGSWAKHTASWWAVRNAANVLLLTYGDMKRNPRQAIQRIADFMEVPLTESQLANVLEKSSFAYMKAHESQFGPLLPSFSRRVSLSPTLCAVAKAVHPMN